ARTGDIGLFKIVSEGGVSAGVRRVEALTGQAALDHVAGEGRALDEAASLLGGSRGDVVDRARAMAARIRKVGASWNRSRPRPPAAPPPTWPVRRWTCPASRCWPRAWKASTPRACARRWTAS